jgi:hypothetical protein
VGITPLRRVTETTPSRRCATSRPIWCSAICACRVEYPVAPQDLEPVEARTADEDQMLALILEAHRRWCVFDSQTHAVFQDVVTTLEKGQRGN